MTAVEVLDALGKAGLADGVALFDGPKDATLIVPRERLRAVMKHLSDDRALSFEMLVLVTGTHLTEKKDAKGVVQRAAGFEVIYHLRSVRHGGVLPVKVKLAIDDPSVDSVADLWAAADWHERETFDLVGIRFTGHPNLRRILLPEDWEGHPLRKDYVFPKEYQGINLEVDAPWPTP